MQDQTNQYWIIHVGDVFRNPLRGRIDEPYVDGFRNIKHLTRGRFDRPGNFGQGMPRFAKLTMGPRRHRIPATWFHSKKVHKEYPDEIDIEKRYVKYYGDNGWNNRRGEPHSSADDSYGIKMFNKIERLYFSNNTEERGVAPPILITQEYSMNNLAMRKFIGVGVLVSRDTIIQSDQRGNFENVLYHVGLLDLPDGFDWGWIDDLRDPNLDVEATFNKAPASWRDWVEHGDKAMGWRSVGRPDIVKHDAQTDLEELEPDDGTGYVYAITNPAWEDYVKIGQARDAKERVGDYQTYSPERDYKLVHDVYSKNRIQAEKEAHMHAARLAYGRHRGEWFRISIEQAMEVLDGINDN